MKYSMTKWCSPFVHVVPSRYEKWFEQLAADGWHPKKIDNTSSLKMEFVKAEPLKYRYVVDLQTSPKPEYRKTYEDFGWEFVGQMSSIFIWRKEYTDTRPESFSDQESLIKRNKRFLFAILIFFSMFLLAAIGLTIVYPVYFSRLNIEQHMTCVFGLILSYGLTITLGLILKEIYKNLLA